MPPAKPGEILRSFKLPRGPYEVREYKEGLINDTFIVLWEGQKKYILQRINNAIFKDPQALMDNLLNVLPLLSAHDYQPLQLIETAGGKKYLDTGAGGCWRLMSYIPGSITYNTTANPQTAFESGRILGRFHKLLQGTNPGNFTNVLPGFHDLPIRVGEYRKALGSGLPDRLGKAEDAIRMAGVLINDPLTTRPPLLPLRICHNDTKLNNILFSEKSGKALCLIDLDTVMAGYFMYDFGDAVRTIVNSAAEDEATLSRISFSRPLFEEFVRGIATQEGLLSAAEIQSLSMGAVYMPLLHGLRALTDYLSGDIYYQTTYEGQNLRRSMSLLTFAQLARRELPYMERVIAEKLIPS